MSKKEKDFKRSFGQEKARVKLYKAGKHWVKAGIREFQLLKMLGVPFLNKEINDVNDNQITNNSSLKKQALRTTGLAGGAFTFAMLNDHHAFAASETPMTSEISSNSATVANQNSTAISKSTTKSSSNMTSSSQEHSQNSRASTESQVKTDSTTNSTETSVNSTSDKEMSTSEHKDSTSHASTSESDSSTSEAHQNSNSDKTSASNENGKSNTENTSESNKEKTSESQDQQSESEKSTSSSEHKNSQSTKDSESKNDNKTSNSSENGEDKKTNTSEVANSTQKDKSSNTHGTSEHKSTETSESDEKNNSLTTKSTSTSESQANRDIGSNLLVSDSTSLTPKKLRTFSRFVLAANNTSATVAEVTNNDIVTINKDNFTNHFNVKDSATYDPKTGIVTLTPDEKSKKGSITLNTKINSNKSFHFTGKVNLGNRYEGHNEVTKDGQVIVGGDGIGFAFSPGKVDDTGKEGAAVGIGGLANSFGFKLDTYHNTSTPAASAKAGKDPANLAGGGAFGAFVSTDSSGKANTDTTGAAKLNVQPTDNSFQEFDIDYNGDTKVMTVTYAGQQFTRNISD